MQYFVDTIIMRRGHNIKQPCLDLPISGHGEFEVVLTFFSHCKPPQAPGNRCYRGIISSANAPSALRLSPNWSDENRHPIRLGQKFYFRYARRATKTGLSLPMLMPRVI